MVALVVRVFGIGPDYPEFRIRYSISQPKFWYAIGISRVPFVKPANSPVRLTGGPNSGKEILASRSARKRGGGRDSQV